MKERKIQIKIEEYDNDEALSKHERDLLHMADEALTNAYAPYSEFKVGAALKLNTGEVVTGSNQENAAYPSGLCAERVALFHAKSQFPDKAIESLAITAHSDHFDIDHPITPCGSCRQVIAEIEGRQSKPIRIIMRGDHGPVQIVNGISNLLPLMFKEENLKRSKSRK